MMILAFLLLQSASEHLATGKEKMLQKDFEAAIREFTKALELEPRNIDALYARAEARRAIGDFDAGIADCDQILKIDPRHVKALCHRGWIRSLKGDQDGCVDDCTRAIEIDPKNAWGWAERGAALRRKGKTDEALSDLTRAIELAARYDWAWDQRGLARHDRGDYDGALADFTRAIEINSARAEYYANRASLQGDRQAWQKALEDYRKAVDLLKTDADGLRLRMILVRIRLGVREEALKELRKEFGGRDPSRGFTWEMIVANFLQGDLSEEELLKKAEVKRKDEPAVQRCGALYYAGTLRLINGDKEGAKKLFRACRETGSLNQAEYRSAAAELKALEK